MKQPIYSILTTVALFTFTAGSAHAAPMFFTDQSSFDSATSALTFGLEDFSSQTPRLLADNTPHTFNGFTADSTEVPGNNTAFYVAPDDFSGAEHTPFTTSQHLGWAESVSTSAFSFSGFGNFGPTITLTFANPLNALSFMFLDSDSTDEYRLAVDGVDVGSVFPPTGTSFDNSTFFGIVDNMGTFQTITFSTPTTNPGGFVEEFGIDDVRYANATATSLVPEPASMTLFSLGALGMGFAARRRRQRVES